jgi:hypothetical protein
MMGKGEDFGPAKIPLLQHSTTPVRSLFGFFTTVW